MVVFCFAFLVRFGTVAAFPNIYRPDEVFQTLEPGFRMWSGGGVVTWEWREGIRSPILPALVAGIIGLGSKLGLNADGYMLLVQAVFAAIASAVAVVGFILGRQMFGIAGALICGVLCAAWPDLVYFGPKLLTEIQAGNLLVIAACITISLNTAQTSSPVKRSSPATLILLGALLGFVFLIRFHLAVGIMVVGLNALRVDFRRRWLWLAGSFVAPVILSGLVDRLYWGSWFQSVWLNYVVNVTQHVADDFGVQSKIFFASDLVARWGSALVILLVFAAIGARFAPSLALVALGIILSHSLIAHKEASFIYAAVPPLVILAGLGTADVVARLTPRPRQVRWASGVVAVWLAVCVTLAFSQGFRSRWTQDGAALRAAKLMVSSGDVCGLAVDTNVLSWLQTGGDAYLGRPVPIYAFHSLEGRDRVQSAANYALGGADIGTVLPGFDIQGCWAGIKEPVCLARSNRATCTADPGLDLNNVPNLGRKGTLGGADFGTTPLP